MPDRLSSGLLEERSKVSQDRLSKNEDCLLYALLIPGAVGGCSDLTSGSCMVSLREGRIGGEDGRIEELEKEEEEER